MGIVPVLLGNDMENVMVSMTGVKSSYTDHSRLVVIT